MRNTLTIAIAAAIIIGVAYITVRENDMPIEPVFADTATSTASYSLGEVADRADQSNCWTAIEGKVYDLTPWIVQHPGGAAAILKICGKDGSSVFGAKHGGKEGPENALAGFYIGELAE